jgi:hypothetical protein
MEIKGFRMPETIMLGTILQASGKAPSFLLPFPDYRPWDQGSF